MSEYNSERTKERLLKRIRYDKTKARKNFARSVLRYTVVSLVFLVLGYGYHRMWMPNDRVGQKKNYKDVITLRQSDGTLTAISADKNTSVVEKNGYPVGFKKGNQLIYHRATTNKEWVFNTINVPYGKRFELVLADGTKAHLNSGTTLKYPVQFKKGKAREVILDGEGFFEVTKDEAHPFIVNTDALNIRVLGTKFNLSAYADDENISTVLVEGEVGFFDTSEQFDGSEYPRLVPGHRASWQKKDKKIEIEEIDTSLYTGWREGQLIFDHMPFSEIRKKLERNYQVSILNKDKELEKIKFTASFDTETIEQVLVAFSKNHPMKYSINTNQINIEKP